MEDAGALEGQALPSWSDQIVIHDDFDELTEQDECDY
jgi:hypothetical protein